ncbi:hypothetical protein EH228_08785 [Erwinia endophytica]|uniref:hypothetical protein n=1 Tax=Erwinia endophytica TaxID=1563158 RepID=UPI00126601D4|nr:hypothetical protein [Erwinia endophytica]KAB8312267.1 hypothetical protein EH228_08785 [Erwinia endophytica]
MKVELIVDGKIKADFSGNGDSLRFQAAALSALADSIEEHKIKCAERTRQKIKALDNIYFKTGPKGRQKEGPEA